MKKRELYRFFLRNILFWLMYLPVQFCSGQTTNISGVVNSYYSIIEIVTSPACIRVSNPTGLSTATKVLIVQMKGGSINTSSASSSTWGDTTSLNDAGNYEVNYICYIHGDSVFLVYNLLNNYTAPSGKVQLVPFARYINANVIGTVIASPWDSTSGTGGVIAIDVEDILTLNASISADSAGFIGGIYAPNDGTCPVGVRYAYPDGATAATNGAYKGEGISDVPLTADCGKGAPANGGGGGNNHNNSGAGGANLTVGGRGGGNSGAGPLTCITGNNFGLGGKALSSWNGKKIFAGGGGGAGHNNNGVFQLGGGDGGGLIFIHAETLIGNGRKITASGGPGGRSQGDGAGGGGAGGTIIMDVLNYSGSAIIQANGGNGGNSNDVSVAGRCFGGGGGGSGGVIYFTGATPSVTVYDTAGWGGIETNRSATCATPVPGLAGSTGLIIPDYSYQLATVFATSCGTPLPVTLVSFRALLLQQKVLLNWRIASPELVNFFTVEKKTTNGDWTIISTIAAKDIMENYSTTDNHPVDGDNQYRLKITGKSNTITYSSIRHIYIGVKESFSVFPNPASDKITIRGHFTGSTGMKLLDITGKIIMEHQLTNAVTELKLPSLQSGIYLLRIGTTTTKLVIR